MFHSSSSALITNKGERILLRLDGHIYDLSQDELRAVLGLPAGAPGLGISIDDDQLSFEFAADDRVVNLSTRQLQRRLAKQSIARK